MADSVEAMLLIRLRRFAEALPIELSLVADPSVDQEMRANASLDSGRCYKELGLFVQAKNAYLEAIRSYEALGLSARRAIARWGLARVFFVEGHYEPALTLLQKLRLEFDELGMAQDVALSALDVADVLLALGRPAEIADLCRASISYFGRVGLAYSDSAMTALAFLREAAERSRVTPATVNRVRTYFEVLPKQPNLLFAFPA
jgi:tetratricopeptide (TPR) repeat protein